MNPPDIGPGTALFLDIDGTLLEFAERPDEVLVPPDLAPMLRNLSDALGGALAVVSGRPIHSIDRLLRPFASAAAGQHGAEWRGGAGAPVATPDPPAAMEQLRARLGDLAAALPDIFLEPKAYSVTIHYHGAGAGLESRLAAVVAELGGEWQLLPARQALEVKLPSYNKGIAIRRFLAVPPFRGRTPMFLGDDLTDEDGFAVVAEAGGCPVRVGPVERPSIAKARLAGPREARRWLAEQLASLTRTSFE